MESWEGEHLKNGHVVDALEGCIACRRIMRKIDLDCTGHWSGE